MRTSTIQGTYGSHRTPCRVFTATDSDGTTWYAVEDSANVNATTEDLEEGVNVEQIDDHDTFTWPEGIDSEETLSEAVNA